MSGFFSVSLHLLSTVQSYVGSSWAELPSAQRFTSCHAEVQGQRRRRGQAILVLCGANVEDLRQHTQRANSPNKLREAVSVKDSCRLTDITAGGVHFFCSYYDSFLMFIKTFQVTEHLIPILAHWCCVCCRKMLSCFQLHLLPIKTKNTLVSARILLPSDK